MSAHLRSQSEQFNALALRKEWSVVCDDTLGFDSGRLATLLGVWRSVKGARHLPMRADFTARALVHHLRDLTFVDCLPQPNARSRYRFRLFGSGLARYTGDSTGKFLDEVIAAPFIESWHATFDLVLGMRQPLRFISQFRDPKFDYMTAESLIAPLCDASGAPCGLLTSVHYTARVP